MPAEPITLTAMAHAKVGRNDPCPCGSGKKYKQCCEAKAAGGGRSSQLLLLVVAGIILAAIFFGVSAARHDSSTAPAAGQVWSPEHGHYH